MCGDQTSSCQCCRHVDRHRRGLCANNAFAFTRTVAAVNSSTIGVVICFLASCAARQLRIWRGWRGAAHGRRWRGAASDRQLHIWCGWRGTAHGRRSAGSRSSNSGCRQQPGDGRDGAGRVGTSAALAGALTLHAASVAQDGGGEPRGALTGGVCDWARSLAFSGRRQGRTRRTLARGADRDPSGGHRGDDSESRGPAGGEIAFDLVAVGAGSWDSTATRSVMRGRTQGGRCLAGPAGALLGRGSSECGREQGDGRGCLRGERQAAVEVVEVSAST